MGEFRDKVLDVLLKHGVGVGISPELADAIERLHNAALAEAVRPWRDKAQAKAILDRALTLIRLWVCPKCLSFIQTSDDAHDCVCVGSGQHERVHCQPIYADDIAAKHLLAPKPPCGTCGNTGLLPGGKWDARICPDCKEDK